MTVRGSDIRLSDESSSLKDLRDTGNQTPGSGTMKKLSPKSKKRDSTFEERFCHSSLPVHPINIGSEEPKYDEATFVLRSQTSVEK